MAHLFKPPPTFQDFFTSPASLFLITLLLLAIGYKTARIIVREHALERDLGAVEERIQTATQNIKELKAAIAHSQDAEIIERIAKEQLNLQNAGEEVAVIVPEAPDIGLPQPAMPFWKSLWKFLTDNRF